MRECDGAAGGDWLQLVDAAQSDVGKIDFGSLGMGIGDVEIGEVKEGVGEAAHLLGGGETFFERLFVFGGFHLTRRRGMELMCGSTLRQKQRKAALLFRGLQHRWT